MRRALVVAAALALVLAHAAPAHAQANARPTSRKTEYSPYEREAAEITLRDLKLELDPAPEGKKIGKITSVRLDVLEPRDPGPELLKPIPLLSPLGTYITKPMLNWLHITTKEFIIRRELLLKEGEPYQQVMIDETARNIRSRMSQVTLVILLPIKTSEEGVVDVLVITKDIWSLRLSFNLVGTANGVEDFLLVPQETNFLGLQHTVSTRFRYQPETLAFGVGYSVPRFGYSWIGAATNAGIVFNRRSGQPEGANIALSVAKPLFSTRTDWGWDADIGYSSGVSRRYSNAQVLLFDSRRTPERDNIPWQFRAQSFSSSASLTRSFGWAVKNNFTLSANAVTTNYESFDLPASRYNPVAVAAFKSLALPTSENRVYPALGWHSFQNDFVRTLDINTLGLQEDYRMGYDVSASVYPVLEGLGSSRNLIGVSAKWAYAVALGDGFAGASLSTFAEDHEGKITDGSISAAFGAATPRFKIGRIVMNTSWSNRYANYLNSRAVIGGSDRLRGYPTGFFSGKDTVFFNIEYRSRAIEILKAQVGGVLFMDAGDAADGVKNLQPKQSVGTGVRVLLPQINRSVFRVDIAFPIQRGPFPDADVPTPVDPYAIFFGFDQAFSP